MEDVDDDNLSHNKKKNYLSPRILDALVGLFSEGVKPHHCTKLCFTFL